jgi:Domain of unknown function DUF11
MNFSRSIAHSLRVTTATFVNPSHHKYLLSVLLLLCPIAAAAQGTPPSWVQAFGSSGNGSNIANAIKAAPDHSLYVGGQFSGTATFGGTSITATGGFGIFVAKYSPSGSLLWIAQTAQSGAGAGGNQAANGIDLDADGNVYATGSFYGNATFYSASAADKQIKVASGVVPAIFLAKYSSAGVLLWVQTVTSDQYGPDPNVPMIGKGVAVNAAAGTVYIGCFSQADLTFSSADGSTHTFPGTFAWHMALAKYDLDGNFKWAATNYGGGNTGSYGVTVDAQDNSYAIGWFEGQATFSSANGHDITIDGFGGTDIFLVKYDTNGNAKWANHIGGNHDIPSAVTRGPSGEITLAGFVSNGSQTIVSSQPPGANINLGSGIVTNPGNIEGVTATYNPAGVAIRATRRGGPADESATGVGYDSRDNLYVALVAGNNGKPQVFVDEYSGNNLLWEATADAGTFVAGIEPSATPRLTVDDAGRVSVAGGYRGTATFGDIKLSGTGTTEVFVAELNTAYANQTADLLLRLSASPTPVKQGDLLTFTFPVWNRGPNVAYLESLKTQVPAGTTFDYVRISGTQGLGTCTTPPYGGTGPIVCYENSAMAPNTTWTLRLTVKVTAPAGSVITETGTAAEVTPDPNPSDATATVTTAVE